MVRMILDLAAVIVLGAFAVVGLRAIHIVHGWPDPVMFAASFIIMGAYGYIADRMGKGALHEQKCKK